MTSARDPKVRVEFRIMKAIRPLAEAHRRSVTTQVNAILADWLQMMRETKALLGKKP
jgi:hypothetical protein